MDVYRCNELLILSAVLALLTQFAFHQFNVPKAICTPIGVAQISNEDLLRMNKCVTKWQTRLTYV